jgi:predicted amidohydrolase
MALDYELNITLIQSNLYWEDVNQNLSQFDDMLNQLQSQTDLIILPEMFNTGFSMSPIDIAESMDGPTIEWMRQKATKLNCAITGSLAVLENGMYYNRLIWMHPDGTYSFYNKRHLFRMGNEQHHFVQGEERLIVEFQGWKICPLVCYDLRFPVWSRNQYSESGYEYDLLIYVANWPASRAAVYKNLLVARAIENLCYVAGVNRIGTDGNGIVHQGDSTVIDFKGNHLCILPVQHSAPFTVQINRTNLENFRKKFQVGPDWDHFEITL